jgi:hypothetical protein
MRSFLPALVALLAPAVGCKPDATSLCQDFCVELVSNCAYDAFPSIESCQQGCEYNASQGADVDAQYDCVVEAACDTFQIIECEHQYGLGTDGADPATSEAAG